MGTGKYTVYSTTLLLEITDRKDLSNAASKIRKGDSMNQIKACPKPLRIEDVAELTGHSEKTASRIMDETGYAFTLHTVKMVLPEDMYAYLKQKAGHDDEDISV